jgi:hypothetical protein
MDFLVVLVRLLHILFAVAWVGMGFTLAMFVGPAAGAAGESGLRFLRSLYVNTKLPVAIASVGGLTVLAGIILYILGSPSRFSSTGNMVLGFGAVIGIAAVIHGGAVTGRATRAVAEALAQNVPADNQPIQTDKLPALRDSMMALASHSRISFILTVVALIAMGTARYL